MPPIMQWNPEGTWGPGFEWGPGPGQQDLGDLMGQQFFDPVGPGARYERARQEVFPTLGQRPRLGRALDRALPFLYSNYLAGLSAADVDPAGAGIDAQGFGTWMLGNQGGQVFGATGSPAGVGATRWGGVGGMYGQLPGAYMPEGHDFSWSDLMQAARQGAPVAGGGGADPRYWELLQAPGAPQAFTQVATAPRPGMAGSVVANMQARAMQRKHDAWNIERGGTGTDIDWLGYITGESGLAREPYRTTPTAVAGDATTGDATATVPTTTAVTGDVTTGDVTDDATGMSSEQSNWFNTWMADLMYRTTLDDAEGDGYGLGNVTQYLVNEIERRNNMDPAEWQRQTERFGYDPAATYATKQLNQLP